MLKVKFYDSKKKTYVRLQLPRELPNDLNLGSQEI